MLRSLKRDLYFTVIISYLLLLFLHLNIDVGEFGTDDFLFMRWSKTSDYSEWITNRYETWSGRVSVDSVLFFIFNDNVLLWRLANPLIILLLTYTLARLTTGKNSLSVFLPFSIFAFSLIGLIYSSVLIQGTFWITGSLNYLWPVTLGLFSILPFTDSILFDQESRPNIYHFAAGAFAALGQEQVALFILSFIFISIALMVWKRRKISAFHLIQFVLILSCAIFLLAAPGNSVRIHRAVGLVFPGFDNFSFLSKVLFGLQFLIPAFVITSKLLLLILWVLVFAYFIKHDQKNVISIILTLFLATGIVVTLLSLDQIQNKNIQNVVYNFGNLARYDQATSSMNLSFDRLFIRSAFSVLFWSILLFLITPAGLFRMFRENLSQAIAIVSIYLGSIFVLVILFFSPTIINPGYRVSFFPAILLIILIILTTRKLIGEPFFANLSFKAGYLILPVVAFLPYYLIFNNYFLSQSSPAGVLAVSDSIMCSIDSIEPKNDFILHISGWAVVEGFKSDQDLRYIVLQSPEKSLAFTTKVVSRPDVTNAMKDGINYTLSGIEGNINILDLDEGSYKVGFQVINKKNNIENGCMVDKTVHIEKGGFSVDE